MRKVTKVELLYRPSFLNPATGQKMPNTGEWQTRHLAALTSSMGNSESAIVGVLAAWGRYADGHAQRFESRIGNDYVLGPAWADIGRGMRTLLNGETGRLDCGTLDGFILDALAAEGFNDD